MKTLYIQCNMGAAGDMLTAALLELLPEEQQKAALEKMNSLLPDVEVSAEPAAKCGIYGTHVTVKIHGEEEEAHDHHHDHEHHHHDHEHPHDHEHHHDHEHPHTHAHSSYESVKAQIGGFDLPEEVKEQAYAAYELIAAAESKAHGVPVEQVHFHEVGEKDAIVDVTSACYLMHLLAPEQVIVSPIHVGSGSVRTAHGILPVPAPATADILTGMPWYSSEVKGELCTPTGAALLKTFADSYGPMPVMNVAKTGYGMGKKEFAEANCVRAFWGETMESFAPNSKICELAANLDDMTPEAIGFATGILMEEGALDAYVIPVTMKKNRPGHVLNCICKEADADKFARLILKHTTTFGVRRHICDRYTLEVSFDEVETPYGTVRRKTGKGYGVEKTKLEYEDAARCARGSGVSLQEIYK